METQMQLRDPEVIPSEMVLKRALGDSVYTLLASCDVSNWLYRRMVSNSGLFIEGTINKFHYPNNFRFLTNREYSF